jgi:NIPSNAP
LEGRVVVEERIYTLQPGKVAEYFRIEADHGADIYLKTMGRVVGVFATEFGTLNQIVHMCRLRIWRIEPCAARRCGPIRSGKPMHGRCGQ